MPGPSHYPDSWLAVIVGGLARRYFPDAVATSLVLPNDFLAREFVSGGLER